MNSNKQNYILLLTVFILLGAAAATGYHYYKENSFEKSAAEYIRQAKSNKAFLLLCETSPFFSGDATETFKSAYRNRNASYGDKNTVLDFELKAAKLELMQRYISLLLANAAPKEIRTYITKTHKALLNFQETDKNCDEINASDETAAPFYNAMAELIENTNTVAKNEANVQGEIEPIIIKLSSFYAANGRSSNDLMVLTNHPELLDQAEKCKITIGIFEAILKLDDNDLGTYYSLSARPVRQ